MDIATLTFQSAMNGSYGGGAPLSINNNISSVFDLRWSSFPTAAPRFSGYDVVASVGGIWFYVPSVITFFVVLVEVHTPLSRFLSRLFAPFACFFLSNCALTLSLYPCCCHSFEHS